jgi:hypothetical protein
MLSSQIATSDEFLEMPLTSQTLYFHLGMSADDDGLASPRRILRMTGAGEHDLKVLMSKNLVIPFNSGVIVITHWKQNNYRGDGRYTPTIYKDEMNRLSAIQGVQRLNTIGIPELSKLDTPGAARGMVCCKNDPQAAYRRHGAGHPRRGPRRRARELYCGRPRPTGRPT